MADSFELTIQVDLILSLLGSFSIAPDHPVGTPKYSAQRVELANGDNTFAVPTGSTYCLILFDPTSATTKKIKGAGGDTGVTIQVNRPVLIPTLNANIIINSSAADTGLFTQVIFF